MGVGHYCGFDNELFVSAHSEVEEVKAVLGGTSYSITEKGFALTRDGENLSTVLNEFIAQFGALCDELSKVVVSMGVTPNVPAITQIKQEATQAIKQRLNTILIED